MPDVSNYKTVTDSQKALLARSALRCRPTRQPKLMCHLTDDNTTHTIRELVREPVGIIIGKDISDLHLVHVQNLRYACNVNKDSAIINDRTSIVSDNHMVRPFPYVDVSRNSEYHLYTSHLSITSYYATTGTYDV